MGDENPADSGADRSIQQQRAAAIDSLRRAARGRGGSTTARQSDCSLDCFDTWQGWVEAVEEAGVPGTILLVWRLSA